MEVSWLGISDVCVRVSASHCITLSMSRGTALCLLQDFKKVFPGTSDGTRDLLRKLLTFNPHKRLSVQDALEHPDLAKVRKQFSAGKPEPECKAGLFDDSFEHDYPLEIEMPKKLLQKYMFE